MPPSELRIIIKAVNEATATLGQILQSLSLLVAAQEAAVRSGIKMEQNTTQMAASLKTLESAMRLLLIQTANTNASLNLIAENSGRARSGLDSVSGGVMSLTDRIERALVFFVAFRAFWEVFNFITDRVRDLFELEQQLKRVQSATMFDPSGVAKLNDVFVVFTENMMRFGTTVKETGDAFFEIISSGLGFAESQKVLVTVLGLVKAGVSDVGTAARAVSSIYKTWGVDAERIGDVMAFVLNQTQSEIGGFVTALQRTAATARFAGLSFEQTALAIGIMNDAMIFGGNTGRAFRRGIEQIIQETDFFEKRLGIVIDRTKTFGEQFDQVVLQLSKLKFQDNAPAVGELAKMFERLGIQGQQAVSALILMGEKYSDLENTLKQGGVRGELQAIVEMRLDNAIDQWKRLKNAVTAAIGAMSSGMLADFLRDMANTAAYGMAGPSVTALQNYARELNTLKTTASGAEREMALLLDRVHKGLASQKDMEDIRELQATIKKATEAQSAAIAKMKEVYGELPQYLQQQFRPLMEQLGVLPKIMTDTAEESKQASDGLRVVTEETKKLFAELTNRPLREQLLANEREQRDLYAQLAKYAVIVTVNNQEQVIAQEKLDKLIQTQAGRQKIAMIAAGELHNLQLRAAGGVIDNIEKLAKQLGPLITKHEQLSKAITAGNAAQQTSIDQLGIKGAALISDEEKLIALLEAEVTLRKERNKLLTSHGLPVEGLGEVPQPASVGRFSRADADRLVANQKQLIENLAAQATTREKVNAATQAGNVLDEQNLLLMQRIMALQSGQGEELGAIARAKQAEGDAQTKVNEALIAFNALAEKHADLLGRNEQGAPISAEATKLQETALKTLLEAVIKLTEAKNRLKIVTQEQAVIEANQMAKALERSATLRDREAVALLRGIDLREKAARAAGLFSDAEEEAFNADRLAVLKQQEQYYVKIIADLSALTEQQRAEGTLNAALALERADQLDRNIAKLDELRGKIIDLDATQGDFWTAFGRGANTALSEMSTGFKETFTTAKTLITDLQRSISDTLFTAMTAGFKNLNDLLTNFKNSLLRFLADFASKRIMEAIFGGVFSVITSTSQATAASQVPQWAAATEAISNVNALSTAATGASEALTSAAQGGSLLTGALSAITNMIGLFALGINSILQFIGSLASGNAAGGIAGMLGAGGGSPLGTLATGLTNIFASLSNAGNQILQGFASMSVNMANALGASVEMQAQIGNLVLGLGEVVPYIGIAYGLYQMFTGKLSPLSGAMQGAMIGTMIAPGIGTAIGAVVGTIAGFISGLFGKPEAYIKGNVQLDPTNLASLMATKLVTPEQAVYDGHTATIEAGPFSTFLKKRHMSGVGKDDLSAALTNAVIQSAQAVFGALDQLSQHFPPKLGGLLSAQIEAVLAEGFELTRFKWDNKSKKKVLKQFNEYMERLPGDIVEGISDRIFGDIDLTSLGGGDRVKGFDAIMSALGTMSAVLDAAEADMSQYTGTLADFTHATITYFTQFQQEGEAFIDTVKRVGENFLRVISVIQQIDQAITAIGTDLSVVTSGLRLMQAATDQVQHAADALTVAIESGSSPEEVAKAAEAAVQAVTQAYQQQVQIAAQLHDALLALNRTITDGVDYAISLSQKIDALRGTLLSPESFEHELQGLNYLFHALDDINSKIAIWSAGIRLAAENLSIFTAQLPRIVEDFSVILDQIRQMSNPTEALAALQELGTAVETGLADAIAAVNRETQVRVAALEAEKSAIQQANTAQIAALNDQKAALETVYDAQKEALQTQLSLAQQWNGILSSVKAQLTDLFNLLAPTHPLTSLNEVLGQFRAAFANFQASPTPEGATQVQELARQVLQLGQETPGYNLASEAFQVLAAEVQAALQAVQGVAEAQPTQEQIQAQIIELDQQQADSLAHIESQLAAIDQQQTAQLAAIDAQIAEAQAAGQAQIQEFQDLAALGLEAIRAQVVEELTALAVQQADAAEGLQAVLGDKTYEHFIAEKQREAVDALNGINNTLKDYLGAILTTLFPGATVPSHAGGLDYVPYDDYTARLHRGERVLTAADNAMYSKGNGSSSMTINIGSGAVTVQVTGRESDADLRDKLDRAMVQIVTGPSLTRRALTDLAVQATR